MYYTQTASTAVVEVYWQSSLGLKNLTRENVFINIWFLILKRKPTIATVETMLLVLNELQKVLKKPSVTFEKLMVCLSCATRFNLETLGKGYVEREGVSAICGFLKRIVQMPSKDDSWLTTLMVKYIEKYKTLLPKCTPSHYSFIGFKNLNMEPSFQRENWIVPLIT